jgi:hypothetical protein
LDKLGRKLNPEFRDLQLQSKADDAPQQLGKTSLYKQRHCLLEQHTGRLMLLALPPTH